MNVVLLHPEEIDAAGQAVLTGRRLLHVRNVLGVVPGARIRVGVVGAGRHLAEVRETHDDGCLLRLDAPLEPLPEPLIDVLLALPRPKCLLRLLPQLAAIGIGHLYLVNAAKVTRDYWGAQIIKRNEFSELFAQGLEQAGDVRVPTVTLSRRFKSFVRDQVANQYGDGCKLVAHPSDAGTSQQLVSNLPSGKRVLLAVGPEGGWTDDELTFLEALGFDRFGLGSRVLRTDTACIALLSVLSWGRCSK